MMLMAKIKAAAVAIVAAGAFLAANSVLFPRGSAASDSPLEAAIPIAAARAEVPPLVEVPITFEAFEPADSPFPPTSDLVGHWKFDDEKGSTTAVDAVGKANGKVVGGASFAEGKVGGALKLDGKGGHVEIPNSEEPDKLQDASFSIVAWFKPEGVPPGTESANDASYGIVLKTGWHLGLNYTNERKFLMTHWVAGEKPEEPTWTGTGAWDEEYEPAQWYHLAGVVDRSGGKVIIYVNGELKNTAEFTANAPAKKYEKETWKIGIGRPGADKWGWPAKGLIDDVRLYSRALGAPEVKALHDGK